MFVARAVIMFSKCMYASARAFVSLNFCAFSVFLKNNMIDTSTLIFIHDV